MAIQRWDPLRDLMGLQEKMNHLFETALSRSGDQDLGDGGSSSGWKPPMDLFEEPERYVLRADLPGVSATEVEIQVADGELFLRGERRMDGAVQRESYVRIERPYGRFAVQVALPPSVEQESIRATHHNGVIEVLLPKKKPLPASRIEVKAR